MSPVKPSVASSNSSTSATLVTAGKVTTVPKDVQAATTSAKPTPPKLEQLTKKDVQNKPRQDDAAQQEVKADHRNSDRKKQKEVKEKNSEKSVEPTKSAGVSEKVQRRFAELVEASKVAVVTGNAFNILDNESDDDASEKKEQSAKSETEPEKKQGVKTEAAQKASPALSPAVPKPKCECGQIVHPSVLNPITEFQLQDRQAHIASKRHQAFVAQQVALQKKERQEQLKQEKIDALKAKEVAQRAKEEAERAIEVAQKALEAKQAEDASPSNKKKPKKKKERKVSLVHPLGGEIIEENTTDTDKVTTVVDPKKKQLASEIQQEANQLYNKGLYAKAVERYTDGITLNPNSAVLFSNRAQAYSKCLQNEKAIADCRKSLELDPTFVKSYHRASSCYIKMGDLKEAKLLLARCRMVCPNEKKDETPSHLKIVEDLEASLDEAISLMNDKQYEDVIDVLQTKVTCQMPEAPLPNYLLAEAYIRVGDFIAADDAASKFFERYPDLPATRIVKALFAYYEEAKLDFAMQLLRAVVAEDALNMKASRLLTRIQKIDTLKKLADECQAEKQYQKAIAAFTEALEVDRENPCITSTLLCCRAGAYFNTGQFVEAKKDLDDAIACAGSFVKAHRLRANVNEKLGAWQGVVEDCRFVLDEEWDTRCSEMMRFAKDHKPALDHKGYYAALALSPDAKKEEITKAYKERIARWDPKKWVGLSADQRANAELQYEVLSQAYSVLSDPVKRDNYDNFNCDENEGKCDCEEDFRSHLTLSNFLFLS